MIWVSCSISLNLRSLNYKKVFNRNVHRLTVTMPNTQYLMNDNYIFLIWMYLVNQKHLILYCWRKKTLPSAWINSISGTFKLVSCKPTYSDRELISFALWKWKELEKCHVINIKSEIFCGIVFSTSVWLACFILIYIFKT